MTLRLTTNSPETIQVPPIPKNLLDYLETVFPDRAPLMGEGLRVIRHKAGQVSVVRHLADLYRRQNETVLQAPAKTSRVSRK